MLSKRAVQVKEGPGFRSSRSQKQMFFKIRVLKKFVNYTGNAYVESLFNKFGGLNAFNSQKQSPGGEKGFLKN